MLFFDLDDTLIDHHTAGLCAAGKFLERFTDELCYTPADFGALWHAVAEKHFARYTSGEVTFAEQRRCRIREIFNHRPLDDCEADDLFAYYLSHYEASWRLFDDILPCFDRLASIPLGIITNGSVEQQMLKLRRTGIEPRFSVIVISEAVGCSKPQPEIFLHACHLAGRPPEQCIYIGDRWDIDILGARTAGMQAIWLNRNNTTPPDAQARVVESLAKLIVTSSEVPS